MLTSDSIFFTNQLQSYVALDTLAGNGSSSCRLQLHNNGTATLYNPSTKTVLYTISADRTIDAGPPYSLQLLVTGALLCMHRWP
jgi:hypothetical protein